jgi:RNA polymerase sigma-70 factor (ECF subfamily)
VEGPEKAIALAAERGRSTWPEVNLPGEVFANHVRRLGVADGDLVLNGADLYLACACAQADERALAILQKALLPAIDGHLRRLGVPDDDLEDVRQLLLVRLLSAPNGGLASYAARSPLVRWLRIVAGRAAIDARRVGLRTSRPGDQTAIDKLVSDGADPEVAAMRLRLKEDFQAALEESLGALSARAKSILRMHYVDGLNIAAIGQVYNVHRATVARWILGIRSAVLARLRQRLSVALRPTSSEFRSLTAAVQSQLEISVDRVLGASDSQSSGSR